MECHICGRNGTTDPLDEHHIFGGANRKLSKKYGAVVRLCHHRCHLYGKYAVHANPDKMQELKQWGQRQVMEREGWSTDEFRAVFGKNYL